MTAMTQPPRAELGVGADPLPNESYPRAALLVNVGTPEAPDSASVGRYLAEFLSDPFVIQLPWPARWLQPRLARLMARRRAPRSAEKYQSIWTAEGSPMRVIMGQQAAALAKALPPGWKVFTAMRYGRPDIAGVIDEITALGIEELVVVPLYPQFSRTTTGTVIRELYSVLKRRGAHINVTARTSWYNDAGYTNAQARLIADFAAEHDLDPQNAVLLYSAHGLPVAYIERGDPYADQVRRSIELVTARLGWPVERTRVAFQSRMGPAAWLKPDTEEALAQLAAEGEKRVLVCPISFVVDCLETLEEIDLRYQRRFGALGGQMYRCGALNANGHFITALKNLVVRGPRAVTSWAEHPLVKPAGRETVQCETRAPLEGLFMVGVSLESRLGPGCGPKLVFSDAGQLSCTKRSHGEVHAFLAGLRADGGVAEAMIWNTCHRFEFYGWLKDGAAERACTIARIRRELLGDVDGRLQVNILFGAQTWRHLMRTVIGLNSGLPGDKDVVAQFQSAYQLAERAGTAGARLRALVGEATALAQSAQAETAWGQESPGYCYAAIARLQRVLDVRLANCRHVVVGGSATSRSVLRALAEHFGVQERNTTLVYRSHQGGQTKLLRKAIGNGRRVRVDSYEAGAVLDAIADADIVYFGIDREQPVLTADVLRGVRDFAVRPLTIVDFNTAGSTAGLETLPGVRCWTAAQLEAEVAVFADELCAREQFPRIVREAEAWVERRAPRATATGLDLPCAKDGPLVNPRCGECGRGLRELLGLEQTA
jgi:ferrochelatase